MDLPKKATSILMMFTGADKQAVGALGWLGPAKQFLQRDPNFLELKQTNMFSVNKG